MDPNATLAELREVVTAELEADPFSPVAMRFAALDEWLSGGGFPPDAWVKNQPVALYVR